MSQKFYYLDGNEQKGPVSIDQLESVGLKSDTLVWTEGLDKWTPAREVEELRELIPPPLEISAHISSVKTKKTREIAVGIIILCGIACVILMMRNMKSESNIFEVRSSDPFCGNWIQVANLDEQEISKEEVPVQIRISKANVPEHLKATEGDIFYWVEKLVDGEFKPYAQGTYYRQDKYLINRAFGSKFSIKISDDSNYFYENAWFGYFKKNDRNLDFDINETNFSSSSEKETTNNDILYSEPQLIEEEYNQSKFLITNNSVGYFKIGGSWQNFAEKEYHYEYVQGYGDCVDACCSGGFVLGSGILTIGTLLFEYSESYDDEIEKNKYKSNPNVFYVSSDNCKGWYWNDKISFIVIYSDSFRTKEGVGVGTTLEDVQKKLGKLVFYIGWIEEDANAVMFYTSSYPNIEFILDIRDYMGDWEKINFTRTENTLTISDFKGNSKVKRIIIKDKRDQDKEEIERRERENREAEQKRLAEEQRKREQDIQYRIIDTSGIGNVEQGSQGNGTNSTRNEGSPFENSDTGLNEGVGGFGGSFNLSGRSIRGGGLPRPEDRITEAGTIVINITVDPKGDVISAEIGRGTNINNRDMRARALNAAIRTKFSSIQGTNTQSGTITYRYRMN